MAVDEKALRASCHCEAIELLINFDLKKAKLEKCNCSMCSRKFAAYVFVDVSQLKIVDKTKSFKWEKGEWENPESFLKV